MPHASQIRFRPLAIDHLALMREWLHRPHVARWWPGWPSAEQVAARYTPLITGADPAARAYIIECSVRPIGYIQCYFDVAASAVLRQHLEDAEQAAGIDLFIGELQLIHRGLGPRIIREFLRAVVFADPAITSCIIDPAHNNHAAIRAYKKVGFSHVATVSVPGELGPQCLMRLAPRGLAAPSPGGDAAPRPAASCRAPPAPACGSRGTSGR